MSELTDIIKQDKLALVGLTILILIILIATFAPFIALYDPDEVIIGEEGIVFKLENSYWRLHSLISEYRLNDITFLHGKAFAVGRDGGIYFLEGESWKCIYKIDDAELNAISITEDFGIAVGTNGTVLEYKGTSWRHIKLPTNADLYDVTIIGSSQALIVGAGETLFLFDDGRWINLSKQLQANYDFYAVSSEDNLVIIVGSSGLIARYEVGKVVKEPALTNQDLFGIAIYQGSAVAVGNGVILKYAEGKWTLLRGGIVDIFYDVSFTKDGIALIVGHNGVVLSLKDNVIKELNIERRLHLTAVAAEGTVALAVGTRPYVKALLPPSWRHLLGTDHIGRDIFSQAIYGSRVSLFVAFVAAIIVTGVGTLVGLIAGYKRGMTDDFLMRIVDIMYSIPFEPFAIILAMLFFPSIWTLIAAITLLTWRTTARIIRSQVLSLSQRPFVKSAKVAGASDARIMFVHILPNALPLVLLDLTITIAWAILAEAALSFLGVGPPGEHSWGLILNRARVSGAWRIAWWWILAPGIFIMLTASSIFLISRALEVIVNPRLRGR